jgi:hypothetical protein
VTTDWLESGRTRCMALLGHACSEPQTPLTHGSLGKEQVRKLPQRVLKRSCWWPQSKPGGGSATLHSVAVELLGGVVLAPYWHLMCRSGASLARPIPENLRVSHPRDDPPVSIKSCLSERPRRSPANHANHCHGWQ